MTDRSRALPDDATMSFGDHLEELRHRILLAVIPAIPVAIGFFFLSETFIRWLIVPLRRVLDRNGLPPELQTLSPPEMLVVQLKLSLIFAAVALSPWIVWQIWLFVRPGLFVHERRFVRFLVPGSAVLTVAGVCLLYFVMLPLMLQVLVTFGSELDLGRSEIEVDPRIAAVLEAARPIEVLARDPAPPEAGRIWLLVPDLELKVAVADGSGGVEILPVPSTSPGRIRQTYRVSTYVNFVLVLLLGIVIAFQMPLVIVLLGWLGLADQQWLRARRKYAVFVCGIVAAVITPADAASMIMMLLPLYALFELGILMLRLAPASVVAEGTLLSRYRTFGRDADKPDPDKPPGSSSKPAEPAQSEGSVPRSRDGTGTQDDPTGPNADA